MPGENPQQAADQLKPHRVIVKFKSWWRKSYRKEGRLGIGINSLSPVLPMLVIWDDKTNRLYPLRDVKYYEFTKLPDEPKEEGSTVVGYEEIIKRR